MAGLFCFLAARPLTGYVNQNLETMFCFAMKMMGDRVLTQDCVIGPSSFKLQELPSPKRCSAKSGRLLRHVSKLVAYSHVISALTPDD